MPRKVLVVDDEKHIVRLIQVNLERQGYEVITANDGKEALQKVEEENPDLIVLDVMMPYMDGFEALQNLRRNPSARDIPVIMLTAKAQDADVFKGWQSGVDCYLTKPFNPMELISFVKRIFKSMRENLMNKIATLLGLVALLVAGCSTGLLRPRVEKGIRDSLPEYIGPAKEYMVHAKGPETSMIGGTIDLLHIEGTDVQLEKNLTIDRMVIDMSKVRFNPSTRAVKSVESTTFEATLSDRTINSYIMKTRGDADALRIRLDKGQIIVDAAPSVAGVSIPLSIGGKAVIQSGDKINFMADSASVSVLPVPAFIVNSLIGSMNPVLDMSKMKFPVTLDSITIGKGSVVVKGNAKFKASED